MLAYVVDSFTGSAFRGNPAGVVVLDGPDFPADEWMQSVAAELNHPETAFVATGADPAEPTPLRWFTPTNEVDLCGHATLATAHVLGGPRRFSTRSGVLICEPGAGGWIRMDFPLDPAEPVEAPEGLADALGTGFEETERGVSDLLVRLDSAEQVRELRPDLGRIAEIPARAVIVTAPGDGAGADFVSRVFGPRNGIPEDPVTGSAHCTLASYWSTRLERSDLIGEQASARGGVVRVALREDHVELHGRAVTVLRGDLLA